MLKPGDQHVESGGEPLAAVVDPDVLADGDQGREAVGRQRTEELVQLGPDGGVADVLLVDRGRVLLTAMPMVWLSVHVVVHRRAAPAVSLTVPGRGTAGRGGRVCASSWSAAR